MNDTKGQFYNWIAKPYKQTKSGLMNRLKAQQGQLQARPNWDEHRAEAAMDAMREAIEERFHLIPKRHRATVVRDAEGRISGITTEYLDN